MTDLTKAKIIELAGLRDKSDHCGWCECMDDREFLYSITLADVLRAIPVGVYMKSLGEQVRFVSYDADMEEHAGLEYWDLLSDYDGQTQDVKEFIGKLLGV